MKTVIIYDSLFGNTAKIAHAVAKSMNPSNTLIAKAKSFDISKLKNINLLVVGSPTHGGRPSPAAKQLLDTLLPNSLHKISAAAFATGMRREKQRAFLKFVIKFFGYAAPRIAHALQAKGADIIGTENFYVAGKEGPLLEGELERATKWGRQLLAKLDK